MNFFSVYQLTSDLVSGFFSFGILKFLFPLMNKQNNFGFSASGSMCRNHPIP